LSGQRKLELVIPKGDDGAAAPRRTRKKEPAVEDETGETSRTGKQRAKPPPSTNVSSPVRARSRGKTRQRNPFVDDEASDEDGNVDRSDDLEPDGALHRNGYEKDGFVISDIDEGSDVDHFDPPRRPTKRNRQQRLEELGPPISRDTFIDEADLPNIHETLIPFFVDEAKQKEETIRNSEGLRRALFKERQFRDMAVRWTVTLDQMRQIPGISAENVDKYGGRFLPIVKKYKAQYTEMMGGGDVGLADIVDLISSDDEDHQTGRPGQGHSGGDGGHGFDEDDFDDDDDDEALEASRYFDNQGGGTGNRQAAQRPRDIQSFYDRLETLNSQQASRAASTGPSTTSTGRGGYNKGKKSYPRRGSGGWGRGGGYPKRGAATGGGGVGKRKSSASGSRSASVGSSKGGAGGAGVGRAKGGKTAAKKAGAGVAQNALSAGSGGIGLMPF
jgi:bloom syndrome protein